MEAATRLRLPARRQPAASAELARLRPFGEAYLMRHFGEQLAHADAEDAVSDVTLRLHRQISAGRPPENLQAAFLTGCRNAAIDRLRLRARKPTIEIEAAADAATELPAPEDLAERREAAARIREVLIGVNPRQRQVLTLRFGLGLTVPEIASRMQVSLPAAKNLLARGIAQARRRHEALAGNRLCPQVEQQMRDQLDRLLAGTDAPSKELRAHLEHCGPCKTLLHSLRSDLHQLGAGAALIGGGHLAALHHLAGKLSATLHTGLVKARLASYKAGGALGTDASGPSGAFTGAGQRALAVCGAASAATCLATGVVGPGLGALATHRDAGDSHRHSAAHVRRYSAPQSPTPVAEPEPEPQPAPAEPEPSPRSQPEPTAQPTPEPEASPAEEGSAEFGFESSAPPPEAEPAPTPPPSASSGGGGGGSESFGFGG